MGSKPGLLSLPKAVLSLADNFCRPLRGILVFLVLCPGGANWIRHRQRRSQRGVALRCLRRLINLFGDLSLVTQN